MTIGAIGSSSSYLKNNQFQNLSSLSTTQLSELMQKYGVQQTGNKATDLQALYQAMYTSTVSGTTGAQSAANDQQQAQSCSHSKAAASNTVPWADLMNQVGLTASGDLNKDYAAFNERVTAMQESLSGRNSQEGSAFISQIQAEAAIIFGQQGQSVASASSSSSSSQVSGADILAQLNKMYLVK